MDSLLLLFVLWIPAQSVLPPNGSEQQQHPDTHQAAPDQQTARGDGNGEQAKQNTNAQPESKGYWEQVFAPTNLSNWVLAGIGVVGSALALCTLSKIERQTKATEKQVEHLIATERALLLFTVRKDDKHDLYIVRTVNYGKIPARKIEIGAKISAHMSVADLVALPPDYGGTVTDIQEYLAPGEDWIVAYIFPQRSSLERFYNVTNPAPTIDFITYGQITYLDGISDEVRHSRYCVALDVDDNYEPITVVGSAEYLECT